VAERTTELSRETLIDGVRAAVAAPSIYNSQPWRFRIHSGGFDVFADWSRRLEVIDPAGRELLMSVGAAIFNVRLYLHERGYQAGVRLFPDPGQSDLVAQIRPAGPAVRDPALVSLARAIARRHTNRSPFAPIAIPPPVLEELLEAARAEGAVLTVADTAGRAAILNLLHTAERLLRAKGIYRAELPGWTHPHRARHDSLATAAFGPWDAWESLPLRDFGLLQPEVHRPIEAHEPYPALVVLSSPGDGRAEWVAAGQALQRVWLTATMHNLAATPLSQPLEIAALRELVSDVRGGLRAQVILRVGYAPPAATTARRPLTDVLVAD
jgi:nitroreductase